MAYGKSLERYKSAALVALAAAVSMGVPYSDADGRSYIPAPRGQKRPGPAHRDGVFTRGGARPRRLHAFLRMNDHGPRDHKLIRTTRVSPSLLAWRASSPFANRAASPGAAS